MGLLDKIKGFFTKEPEHYTQEELDSMTVSEKIDKGAATLWDLTENKDELSKYGQAMQEEIIKESVENTNFNYHDENGSNLLHILAASDSPLDDVSDPMAKARGLH